MKEILFRGKNKVTKEWVKGDLFHHDKQLFISAENLVTEVDSETVGQYIGMTDNNDTKIFEGDIVRYCGEGTFGGFYVYDTTITIKSLSNYNQLSLLREAQNSEIIGNIYDNPELLKGE